MTDQEYMAQALSLAQKGAGGQPQPMVGAVIVKDGQVIGQGYHAKCGDLHAERAALAACTQDPAGATMYVTLEPCCHQGRPAPLYRGHSGSRHRPGGGGVLGTPTPRWRGKGWPSSGPRGPGDRACTGGPVPGPQRGVLSLHPDGKPYVVLKYSHDLGRKDGRYTGASQWITGEEARRHVHTQRNRFRSILVGVDTVLADDPQLTCRIPGGRNPLRIVCDTHLRTPLTAQVVATAHQVPTCLATCVTQHQLLAPYEEKGCQILSLPSAQGHVSLPALLERLGEMEVDSVLLEGGAALHWSAVQAGIVN